MVRLTDRPDMTLDVYRGRKTTIQQQQQQQWNYYRVGQKETKVVVVVVVFLFYVHGKHLRSCRDGRVNLTTIFLGRLRPPKRLTSTSCTYYRQ